MASRRHIRRQQIERQAEGYLELGMPRHALELLALLEAEDLSEHALYLRGEALKNLERYHEAIVPLEEAAQRSPQNLHVWLSLGWCHKRTGRLDLAIEALQSALEAEPGEAIVYYNLACYWSLASNKRQSLHFLSRALELDSDFRDLLAAETDFDPIRSDPGFRALASVIV